MLIDKSKFILSGHLPMTDAEAEAFDMSDHKRTVEILGRKYALCELERRSDGTFTATMMALSEVKMPYERLGSNSKAR